MRACVLPFHDSFKNPPIFLLFFDSLLNLQDTCPARHLPYKTLAPQDTKLKIKIFPKNLKKHC
jgi:hypothetical protein